jgi:hypothetical protein
MKTTPSALFKKSQKRRKAALSRLAHHCERTHLKLREPRQGPSHYTNGRIRRIHKAGPFICAHGSSATSLVDSTNNRKPFYLDEKLALVGAARSDSNGRPLVTRASRCRSGSDRIVAP